MLQLSFHIMKKLGAKKIETDGAQGVPKVGSEIPSKPSLS
jgi:hypothetical protein